MKKKIMLSIGLVVFLLFSGVFFTNGQMNMNDYVSDSAFSQDVITPQYVASCPNYDRHQMRPHGYVSVRDADSGREIWNGQLYVCDCRHVVAIRGGFGPGWSYIGDYYRTWLTEYEYNNLTNFTILYADPSDMEYTGNNYLEGYEFLF